MTRVTENMYKQARMLYRDLDMQRGDLLYDIQRKSEDLNVLKRQLDDVDRSRKQYQAVIRAYERKSVE